MEGGPPVFPADSTCPQVLWILPLPVSFRLRGYHSVLLGFPSHSTMIGDHLCSPTPDVFLHPVWPLPLSLATTRGISFDFSSSGYLDVSVPRVPRLTLWIHVRLHGSSPWEFPHSEICGSKLICSSPQLIAACHVLHRLLMPRHSLCALLRVNFFRCPLGYLGSLA